MRKASTALILLAIALLVRLIFCLPPSPETVETPMTATFNLDARAYATLGKTLAEEQRFGFGPHLTAFRPPLYPFFLAGVFSIFGEDYRAVRIVQALIGSLSCVVLFAIGSRLYGRTGGLLAGLGMAFYPFVIYFTPEIMTETLYIGLTATGALIALLIAQRPTGRRAVLGGIVWGLAMLCRPVSTIYVLCFLIAAVVATRSAGRRALARPLLLVGLIALLVASPWSLRNSLLFERPIFLTTYTGLNLYKGLPGKDNVTAPADIGYEKSRIENPDRSPLPMSEAALDRQALGFWYRSVAADPVGFLKEKMIDVGRLWFDFRIEGGLSGIGGLARMGAVGLYLVILILALIGTVAFWRTDRRGSLLLPWLMIAGTCVAYFPFFSGKRFRIPTVDPYLILIASGFVGLHLDRLLRRRKAIEPSHPGERSDAS